MRVLYFTVTPLGDDGNGGSICCRNHVRRLADDPEIELHAMVAGPHASRDSTIQFFEELGVPCHFQPFYFDKIHQEAKDIKSILSFLWRMAFQFPWETQALNQHHVNDGIDWAIKVYDIDTLVIDYHPSALFLKLPRQDVRTVLVGLNREAEFYADLIELRMTHHPSWAAAISLQRATRFEKWVNRTVDKVVVIGPPDLPKYELPSPPVCITPYLDRKPKQWCYYDLPRIFFVGNVAHYPNLLAVRWITNYFAPILEGMCPSAMIYLVGVRPDQIENTSNNVQPLGTADLETVQQLFQSASLMLCPVANDYGNKFKAIEALSYGTPLLASRQTMAGIPHIHDHLAFDLERPQDAVRIVCELLSSSDALLAFQANQQMQQDSFIATQGGIWSRTIGSIPLKTSADRPLAARSSGAMGL